MEKPSRRTRSRAASLSLTCPLPGDAPPSSPSVLLLLRPFSVTGYTLLSCGPNCQARRLRRLCPQTGPSLDGPQRVHNSPLPLPRQGWRLDVQTGPGMAAVWRTSPSAGPPSQRLRGNRGRGLPQEGPQEPPQRGLGISGQPAQPQTWAPLQGAGEPVGNHPSAPSRALALQPGLDTVPEPLNSGSRRRRLIPIGPQESCDHPRPT